MRPGRALAKGGGGVDGVLVVRIAFVAALSWGCLPEASSCGGCFCFLPPVLALGLGPGIPNKVICLEAACIAKRVASGATDWLQPVQL